MKSNHHKLLILLCAILVLAGCTPDCEEEDYAHFDVFLDSPADGITLNNMKPTFQWHHHEKCKPEEFTITIDKKYGSYRVEIVPGDEDSYIVDPPLEKAATYTWYVQAREQGAHLPWFGNKSEGWTFETPGFCEESELVAPVLIDPPDGKWTIQPYLSLSWEHPADCSPRFYHYQIARDSDFSDIITSGNTQGKETHINLELTDCTTIFWRVAARAGTASSPYSQPFRLARVSSPHCWQNHAPSVDMVNISGYVFEDLCPATSLIVPQGEKLPLGCVSGQGYGVHADGARQRGTNAEAGIEYIRVHLGTGPCPSVGLNQDNTNEYGQYFFQVLKPGTYCISIDKNQHTYLKHGIFTLPLTDQDVVGKTITLTAGDFNIQQNFGWDDYNAQHIDFVVTKNSHCRAGDDIKYHTLAMLAKDDVITLIARNQEATWFKALVDDVECYISIATGQPEDDPSGLPIYDPVARPTKTPATGPDKKCSDYDTKESCIEAGCEWVEGLVPICKEKD